MTLLLGILIGVTLTLYVVIKFGMRLLKSTNWK